MNRYFSWPDSISRFVRFDTARAEEVNAALDELSAGMDTLSRDIDRSIKVPLGLTDQLINLTPLQRAGFLIGFDALGNVTLASPGGNFRGDWAPGVSYSMGDTFRDSLTGNLYAVRVAHVSTILNDDIIANKAQMSINVSDVTSARNAAQAAAAAALVSQNSSTASASAANSSKNAAANSESNAASSASSASGYATTASNAALSASSSAGTATDAAVTATGVVSTVNAAASAASTSASNASTSASNASGSASTATTKAGEASTSALSAANSAGSATASASTASGHATTASNAASTASGHASSASSSASTATTKAGEALGSASAASSSAGNAAASEAKAYQWAEHPEDTEVETGKYSAYHWSLKAEEFAMAASGGASWLTLAGKPPFIGAGDTALDARNAIGAGTSNLAIGSTGVTAKAGNWMPAIGEVTGLTAALSDKASNAALATKADASALAAKADVSALNLKADITAMNLKADSSVVANKVDKVPGKGLSETDFTGTEKTKLSNLKQQAVWFRYVGSSAPDTTGWAANDVWFDTSTPPTFTTAQQSVLLQKASLNTTNTWSSKQSFNAFTKLGSDAPSVKMKKFTGTMSSSYSFSVDFLHGVSVGKIISYCALVFYASDKAVDSSYTGVGGDGFHFSLSLYESEIRIETGPAATELLGKPFVVTIFYEE